VSPPFFSRARAARLIILAEGDSGGGRGLSETATKPRSAASSTSGDS
jgi:hypothetical protein